MRFVLVHGALSGAWIWDQVLPEFTALGHEAVAIDLPGHGGRTEDA
jgi:pimeloyl-ACP methyl ester carboxylesterase